MPSHFCQLIFQLYVLCVLIAGSLFSLQGFPRISLYFPVRDCSTQILSLFSSSKKLWFHCVDYTLHMKSTRQSPNRPTDPKSQQQKQACALSEVMIYRLWNFFLGGDCNWRCPIPADVKNESTVFPQIVSAETILF